jgi:hypothetical protein
MTMKTIVFRLEDLPHAAFTDLAGDAVPPQARSDSHGVSCRLK